MKRDKTGITEETKNGLYFVASMILAVLSYEILMLI